MRLAISGTHGVGKTTLAEAFVAIRRQYHLVHEPYWEMLDAGEAFSDPPTVDEMEQQLAYSQQTIRDSAAERDVIFDRCPLDFLAYIESLPSPDGVEWVPSGRQLSNMEAALSTLDLIVLLPLVEPDEISGLIERPRLRRAMHRRLK